MLDMLFDSSKTQICVLDVAKACENFSLSENLMKELDMKGKGNLQSGFSLLKYLSSWMRYCWIVVSCLN